MRGFLVRPRLAILGTEKPTIIGGGQSLLLESAMIPKMINKRRETAGPGVEPGSLPLIGKALTSQLSGP
ncbi:BZ3500_MvSof-1268-A1-R1_Chr12-3g04038 [Microbotryum saponariae]|uniref:BZ3500_MvSof-1268-A1-R1_Chr12-3g04038 protein n=1 Tax=Microbotryum saponariae TaxID=289078 RepID=A0A2X0LTG5_9BASI|nr:BZ3500_MvSof-1268-A1-R1_Chr12-3g04038 [Microbotryum saponariae]SDA02583.1 BZ3501_MvSof-1269-A2-R1_Chr12-3g03693 [Microbotryum saponariae]